MQTIKSSVLFQTALINVACVILACLVPALSHIVVLPLYKCNPMLFLMLMAIIFTSRSSASQHGLYLSAIAMPAISSLLVGMPSHAVAVCIAAELCTVVAVLQCVGLRRDFMFNFAMTLVALFCAKVVYYLIKWILISPDVLVSTQWQTQMVVSVVAAIFFASMLYIMEHRQMKK